jgi:paired small multidrug resistance pump
MEEKTMNRNWILVLLAGLIEVLWALGLKHASNWLTWVGIALLIYISFVLLLKAIKSLPVATVYAIFTGIGTAGTVVVEMVVFGVGFSWMKVFYILLLLVGVVGLKLVTNETSKKEGAV